MGPIFIGLVYKGETVLKHTELIGLESQASDLKFNVLLSLPFIFLGSARGRPWSQSSCCVYRWTILPTLCSVSSVPEQLSRLNGHQGGGQVIGSDSGMERSLLKMKRKNKIKNTALGDTRKYCSTEQKDKVATPQGVWRTVRWSVGRTLTSCVCIDDTGTEG